MNTSKASLDLPDQSFMIWCTNQCHEICGRQPNIEETKRSIEGAAKDPAAFWFLMVWNIFEKKCCAGDAGKNIKALSKSPAISDLFQQLPNLEQQFLFFYKRYSDEKEGKTRLSNLFCKPKAKKLKEGTPKKDQKKEFSELIEKYKQNGALTNEEKTDFLAQVVYRFRNNIFHVSKGLNTWERFKTEINNCRVIIMSWCEHWAEPPPPTQ